MSFFRPTRGGELQILRFMPRSRDPWQMSKDLRFGDPGVNSGHESQNCHWLRQGFFQDVNHKYLLVSVMSRKVESGYGHTEKCQPDLSSKWYYISNIEITSLAYFEQFYRNIILVKSMLSSYASLSLVSYSLLLQTWLRTVVWKCNLHQFPFLTSKERIRRWRFACFS